MKLILNNHPRDISPTLTRNDLPGQNSINVNSVNIFQRFFYSTANNELIAKEWDRSFDRYCNRFSYDCCYCQTGNGYGPKCTSAYAEVLNEMPRSAHVSVDGLPTTTVNQNVHQLNAIFS